MLVFFAPAANSQSTSMKGLIAHNFTFSKPSKWLMNNTWLAAMTLVEMVEATRK